MFKSRPDTYLYSPSDLVLFERSPFASWMARLSIDKPEQLAGIEKDQDKMMSLLADKGLHHEANYLENFKQDLGADKVCEISTNKETRAAETLKAMQAGYQVIFQAYLERENFAGSADFLVKKSGQSNLGDYYYEAWDTKLSLSTKTRGRTGHVAPSETFEDFGNVAMVAKPCNGVYTPSRVRGQ